jgi:REP element-mobilizing transposase RayT
MLKVTENQIQGAFFSWCDKHRRQMPELELMFAIPNGAYKSKYAQKLFKSTGLKAGVLDVFFPVPRCGFNGMFIEFKSESGRLSPAQKWWIENLRKQGYLVTTCRDWELAGVMVTAYLKGDKDKVTSMVQDK